MKGGTKGKGVSLNFNAAKPDRRSSSYPDKWTKKPPKGSVYGPVGMNIIKGTVKEVLEGKLTESKALENLNEKFHKPFFRILRKERARIERARERERQRRMTEMATDMLKDFTI